jgi:hypothetical protein
MTRKLVKSGSPFEAEIGFSRAARVMLVDRALMKITAGPEWRSAEERFFGR